MRAAIGRALGGCALACIGGKTSPVKVLFDTNIVLDILLKRPGFSDCAMAVAESKEPWLSTLSLANVCYIVGRSRRDKVAGPLEYMRRKFRLGALMQSSVDRAVGLGFEDFEDALQIAVAEENGIPLLVTRNMADFRSTPVVEAVSVEQYLKRLKTSGSPDEK
jgi:predicted nucleic acid-binding protein